MTVALVAVGALTGGMLRYGLTVWFQSIWTVVAINLVGSFVLGLLVHTAAPLDKAVRDGLGVGFLGGFTTFSTLTVQTVLEADGGSPGRAAAYLALTIAGGLLAATAGYLIGRSVT
jgi:fluoride exporter